MYAPTPTNPIKWLMLLPLVLKEWVSAEQNICFLKETELITSEK